MIKSRNIFTEHNVSTQKIITMSIIEIMYYDNQTDSFKYHSKHINMIEQILFM